VYDDEYAGPKKSKLGCFIKILIALLIIAGLGYFGFWYYQKWQDDQAWDGALQKRTVQAFESYIKDRPDGRHVPVARKTIDLLKKREADAAAKKAEADKEAERKAKFSKRKVQDGLAWNKAIAANSIDGYEAYLKEFPNGKFTSQARAAMANLIKAAKEKSGREEEEAWNKATQENSIEAVEAFLNAYPESKMAGEANKLMAKLLEEKNVPIRANEKGMEAFKAGKYDEAIEAFTIAGSKGYAPGLFNLGLIFEKGLGVKADPKVAAEWYQKAAEKGDADAQVNYGYMLEKGIGTKKDLGKAASWYAKAAKQNNGLGQYNLAVLYARGLGIHKDYRRAVKLFKEAAENGIADADKNAAMVERLVPEKPAEAKESESPEGAGAADLPQGTGSSEILKP
jgi:TPR repeat protein